MFNLSKDFFVESKSSQIRAKSSTSIYLRNKKMKNNNDSVIILSWFVHDKNTTIEPTGDPIDRIVQPLLDLLEAATENKVQVRLCLWIVWDENRMRSSSLFAVILRRHKGFDLLWLQVMYLRCNNQLKGEML